MRWIRCLIGVSLILGMMGCENGDDSTQASPVAYPGDFPVQADGSAAEAASWYEVSGLASGTTYLATLAGPQAEPDYDLEVYRVFEPTPPNELCTSYATGADSCTFVAPTGSIFVGVLNLSGLMESYSLDLTPQ